MDRTTEIFGNRMDAGTVKKAEKSKEKYVRKFGDDSGRHYHLKAVPIRQIEEIRMLNLVQGEEKLVLPPKPLVVGNIRMGFGHYRISMAIASCAQALGFTPLWLDLASFDATGSKMIRAQNDLYSLGSRISQKSRVFNSLVWEPMNSEGFRKITYNAVDQKNAELLVPLFADLPKDIPYVATHVWPAQGAVHAGLTHVVNAIPDNWPMGLHLSEGAVHTVQTEFALMGYKKLNGMAQKALRPMPKDSLFYVGHYVDHEFVANIEKDSEKRMDRAGRKAPVRFLLTVGGAGAGAGLYISMVRHLLHYVKKKKASVWINFGDHRDMWERMKKEIPDLEAMTRTYFDDYEGLREFAREKTAGGGTENEVIAFCSKDIFEAVYSTNLLMRGCDILVTKPSELSFYPVPKLMMRHIGGHEVYGGIHAREFGDATWECQTPRELCGMIDSLIGDREMIVMMCESILRNKKAGLYDGGYKAVQLAQQSR